MDWLKDLLHTVLHLDDVLPQWAAQYGVWIYAILFLIVFCETGLVVTPFLPGDSLLFAAGAVDVYTTPLQMKKSRPGVKVSVLTPPARRKAVEEVLLRETPTFGVRRVLMERTKLDRRMVEVQTPFGPIPVKEGLRKGAVLKAAPEYEAAREAAELHGVPLARVLKAAGEGHKHRHNHK